VATYKEIARIRKMRATGRPTFVMGDTNERSEFCVKVARATDLISMNGGTQARPCPVPRGGGPDWMLGAGARFSGFVKDGATEARRLSDHPMLVANAWIPRQR
jgi:hypothetical protein